MLNFHDFVNKSTMFRQFKVDELLYTAYDCPIEDERLDYWTHKNYFFYVIRGSLKWKTAKDDYLIRVGDAVFVKKGTHTAYKVDDGDLCGLLIFVPDEFIKSVVQRHVPTLRYGGITKDTDSIIPLEVDKTLSNYFFTVLNYFSEHVRPSKSLLRIKFEELVIYILTGSKNRLLTHYFEEICCNHKQSFKAIMEDNFACNLKLAEYARLCNRSLATFRRDFAKIYNTSPGRWLKNRRLSHAKFLLETSDMSINEITLESGFENTSHFIKSFKEKYGQPPLHLKKLLLES